MNNPKGNNINDILKLNPERAGTFGNTPTKVLAIKNIWNFGMLEKQCFLRNVKLADVKPIYKKKDPNLVENYRPVSALHSVSKICERIIQKQISCILMTFYEFFW